MKMPKVIKQVLLMNIAPAELQQIATMWNVSPLLLIS